ncbi:MAG: BatA domain-containing protein, partial [Planctomycetes bacterium]|nr:BatA domain-containing protein [Planctomycetota bacterium]
MLASSFPPLLALGPFGSWLMLFWAAAAIIPILIHLWSRRRYRETTWAAMEFLLRAMKKNSRRIRIEQLLLLAMRVAILVLLAVALAEPGCSTAPLVGGSLAGGGQTHTVLVLDGSYSMEHRREEQTRFAEAQQMAIDVVENSRQGDGFTLVLMAEPPRVIIP